MIKFIATDLDGTLVNDEGKIDEKIFRLIKELKRKGIIFAAASGRLYSQLKRNFEQADKDMIFIAHNGALIKYNKNGKTLYADSVSKQDIEHVINLKRSMGEQLFLAGESEVYAENPSQYLINVFGEVNVPVVIVDSFKSVKKPICKLTYFVEKGVTPEILEYLKKNLNDNLECVASGDCWIDIMNKGVSKGTAIKILQQKFNIDEKDTMVFGDYYNDLTMFKSAYYSFAMENAPEEVKKYANFTTKSNNEHGVYKAIEQYVI